MERRSIQRIERLGVRADASEGRLTLSQGHALPSGVRLNGGPRPISVYLSQFIHACASHVP